MSWASIGTAIGGLGLLLLGMGLLTDGLKRAAGPSLHRLLGSWTRTRPRGLAAGALITAVVQSSSAVTVAIVGFANAGLLGLPQAAWVVFGSNLGTTMTGWLVALIGLRVQVEALALPILGGGMLLRLARPGTRVAGIGEALAGFGALFVGLDLLRQTFAEVGGALDLASIAEWGVLGHLAGFGLGALVTVLMQSSSAAMAVILTASSQGVVPVSFAASLVIGANVGTTSTALLSTIGATPNARRVATLHVAFNLLTGAVALAILVPMLRGIDWLHDVTGLAATPAADLALFHTCFNLLGIALMLPVSGRLVTFLERRFRTAEEDAERLRYLDDNVLGVPELAARSLMLELRRASSLGLALARETVERRARDSEAFARRARPVRRLLVVIADYATRLGRAGLSQHVSSALTSLVRAHEDLWTVVRVTGDLISLREEAGESVPPEGSTLAPEYVTTVLAALEAADPDRPDFDVERCRAAREAQEQARDREKARLSELATSGRVALLAANQALQELTHHRRLVRRSWKLAAGMHAVHVALEEPGGVPAAAAPAEPAPMEPADGAAE